MAVTATLRRLTVPAPVGVGEHDLSGFFEGGEGRARDFDAGPAVVIPAAGHLAPPEQPVAFCALPLDAVRRIPGQWR
ncbi:alpha/beta fold hydrolase [Streptomyces sp. NPDC091387]|uniref:alpha/beta fold hydrolase n=1 Tax=Streptomyces sp. NPDC091387 TaxID=3365998 RepID=UPI0037FC5FB6